MVTFTGNLCTNENNSQKLALQKHKCSEQGTTGRTVSMAIWLRKVIEVGK